MKTMVAMMLLLASTGVVACGAAPTEGEDPAATEAPAAAKTEEPKAEAPAVVHKRASELSPNATYGVCTLGEREMCEREDPGGFGAGCLIENGRVVCILE